MAYIGNNPAELVTELDNGVVTTTKLANDAVTAAKIVDGTIVADDLATGIITNAAVAANAAIAATKLAVSGGSNITLTSDGTFNLDATVDVTGGYSVSGNAVITSARAVNMTSGSTTGNFSFGDNDKAIFGAGSDLQLYHDGGNSYIKNTTGWLNMPIGGNGISIANSDFSEQIAKFLPNGACELYYNGSEKLATTSTGIDVTGTATMDSLAVQTTNGLNALLESTTSYQYLQFKNSAETNNFIGFVSDDFVVSPANNQKMIVTAQGKVGIGINPNASADLHVADTSDARIWIEATNGDTMELYAGTNVSLFNRSNNALTFGTNNTERMRIREGGGVAVNTSSFSALGTLVIKQLSDTQGLALIDDSSTNTFFMQNLGSEARISHNDTSPMTFLTNSTERMRIDGATGNVGVGTSSPDANNFGAGHGILAVASATGSAKTAMLNLIGDGNDTANTRVSSVFFNDASATGAGATIAGVEAYRATNHATDPGGNLLFSTNSSGGNYTEHMRIRSDGGVGVNTFSLTNAGTRLAVWANAGSVSIETRCYTNVSYFPLANYNAAGAYIGGINATTTATSLATSSDQRLKENIADADDAGSKVDAIQVRQFDWIANNSHQDYGMVAQELQEVIPDVIHESPDADKMLSVDYAGLVPMLVKEIQSLRARVAQVENN